ncbi:hypothetical protein EVAR_41127_1 [Eumeta japonica]|uniref:Uncharacterized protein n=1 Tax=Eumeta variegata TaxID=151549 RepID=A0A4C1XBK8_EUMVA|nr:hypothetical protein EVAR_41127_1 [Eumeta japonica]
MAKLSRLEWQMILLKIRQDMLASVWWCELCRVYLPRAEAGSTEESEALRRHCRLRMHLGRYVQHRDTRTLRKHAERIHRQLHQQKEEEEKDDASADEGKTKDTKESGEERKKKPVENGGDNADTSGGGQDKLWADVDKDIGEFLREVDPQGNDASDDEEDLGRYDKFRKSDKKLSESAAGGEDADAVAAEAATDKAGVEIKTQT